MENPRGEEVAGKRNRRSDTFKLLTPERLEGFHGQTRLELTRSGWLAYALCHGDRTASKFATITDRMPAILAPEDWATWLPPRLMKWKPACALGTSRTGPCDRRKRGDGNWPPPIPRGCS